MLLNPFTPSEIAGHPEDFFGRVEELRVTERSIMQGSVAIQGGIGIGKSSLLSRIMLLMEGFDSSHKSKSMVAVGDKGIKTIDDAARLLLEAFIHVDEANNKLKINLGPVLEIESSELCKYFATGRHLAALKRILEKEYLGMMLGDTNYLLLAIDEADKCPVPIAGLIRSITTHVQQIGIKNVRFILAGVSPYFQTMVEEDQGIRRFFYKVIDLLPMPEDEATELVETKLEQVIKDAEKKKLKLVVEPSVIRRIVALSGGHPHILQLMGSHLVEHENENPDGFMDSEDLVTSLRAICYEDRAHVYAAAIHMLELYDKLDTLKELLNIASATLTLPTRIERNKAVEIAGEEALEWFVNSNILVPAPAHEYRLMDEFLRIRMILDEAEKDAESLEERLIKQGSVGRNIDDEFLGDEEFPETVDVLTNFDEDGEEF